MDPITHLSQLLGDGLKALKAQVTTAESCTGGGIGEAITRVSGSSAWFEAGYITYSNTQKTLQLGVPSELFTRVGAVSREVVEAMALGAAERSGARFSVAVSGIAGPDGGTADKPVGTVWLAWADQGRVICQCQHFPGDREEVRRQTVKAALEGLIRLVATEMSARG